ncbi:IS4 family transposase [Candidatus Viridilinea mediisalina]|uniref:IS4 family transposase n=1 Tax=Candidatus Viridilinea mediisalina TaxID=2024553 RepID=A0A2A6RDE0_9CHLR|nr:IS4 family transposase [Candidatus Viridilinea mediisalina]PDV98332.1 IS4 family transposase [Candidatus Viridilinea mediisalina]
MLAGKLIFSQIMEYLPLHMFRRIVQRYDGNRKVHQFSCLDQFLCMAFAQLTYRESLRDIEACLRSQQGKLYHMGIRAQVSRNTLANANKVRDWRIYADIAQHLIQIARKLYIDDEFDLELQNTVYALDSTTIDLCLAMFPWANFRKSKGAIKLHTLLDLRGNIPTFIHISDGKLHDVNVLDILPIEAGSFYVMDRGYVDFRRLHAFTQRAAFFVIRAKTNLQYDRIYSHQVDRTTGLICDQSIVLTGYYQSKNYPEKLRRVKYKDPESQKTYVFLTNNFVLPALTITELYRYRWQVELFFKWIKQNLRIKRFYGNSANAVKTQIWIAISTFLIVAIMKKELKINASLYTTLQILSVNIFERIPLLQIVGNCSYENEILSNTKQLSLFD